MKRKKKRMSALTRVLLCSWCVFMLVLTFFILKWAFGLSELAIYAEAGNVDSFAEVMQDSGGLVSPDTGPEESEKLPVPGTTTIPRAEFLKTYAHTGDMTETYGYKEGIAYGMRYPCRENESEAEAVRSMAEDWASELLEELSEEEGKQKTLLIDYEDGETAGIYSVLFYLEKEIDGVRVSETRQWLYNKKKEAQVEDAERLFADRAYKYVAQQVNLLFAEETVLGENGESVQKGTFAGTREEFPEYVLTADGAKFYYETEEGRQSVVIPYIALHTYMAVTENGTVVADTIRELDPDKPMLALTFDDGPHNEQTPRLLEILEKNGVRATFFVLGDRTLWGPSNKKALKQVYDAGHEVASHTYSHKNLKDISLEQMKEEILKAREAIYSVTGEYPTLIRPPYGAYDDEVKAFSYAPLIHWTLDSKDWDFRNSEKIIEHVLAEAKDGKIVLMHDIHWFTVDAAEVLIPALKERGYQLVSVRELLYYKNVELENGRVYHSSYN